MCRREKFGLEIERVSSATSTRRAIFHFPRCPPRPASISHLPHCFHRVGSIESANNLLRLLPGRIYTLINDLSLLLASDCCSFMSSLRRACQPTQTSGNNSVSCTRVSPPRVRACVKHRACGCSSLSRGSARYVNGAKSTGGGRVRDGSEKIRVVLAVVGKSNWLRDFSPENRPRSLAIALVRLSSPLLTRRGIKYATKIHTQSTIRSIRFSMHVSNRKISRTFETHDFAFSRNQQYVATEGDAATRMRNILFGSQWQPSFVLNPLSPKLDRARPVESGDPSSSCFEPMTK